MQIIFIHGLGQKPSSWDKTISYLTQPDKILCPDLFSILDHRETTYENLYHAFSDYCCNISEEFSICGLSLGTIIALNYAMDYPERVKSITLIGAQYKTPKALLQFQNIIFYLIPKKSFIKMGLEKKNLMNLTNSMIDLDFSKKLKDISCPVLIICGEHDGANKKAARDLVGRITDAEFRLIKNAGHEVNVEQPKQLAKLLEDFIKK